MQLTYGVCFVTGLLLLAACKHADTSQAGGCAPGEWNPIEMISDVRGLNDVPSTARAGVLKWQIGEGGIGEEDRYLEVAVVALHKDAQWVLANVYRDPSEDSSWHENFVYDAPVTSFEYYDHPPTQNEIEQFLATSTWRDVLLGFRILRKGDCQVWW